jgi:hypothetical protein
MDYIAFFEVCNLDFFWAALDARRAAGGRKAGWADQSDDLLACYCMGGEL